MGVHTDRVGAEARRVVVPVRRERTSAAQLDPHLVVAAVAGAVGVRAVRVVPRRGAVAAALRGLAALRDKPGVVIPEALANNLVEDTAQSTDVLHIAVDRAARRIAAGLHDTVFVSPRDRARRFRDIGDFQMGVRFPRNLDLEAAPVFHACVVGLNPNADLMPGETPGGYFAHGIVKQSDVLGIARVELFIRSRNHGVVHPDLEVAFPVRFARTGDVVGERFQRASTDRRRRQVPFPATVAADPVVRHGVVDVPPERTPVPAGGRNGHDHRATSPSNDSRIAAASVVNFSTDSRTAASSSTTDTGSSRYTPR